MVLLQNPFVLVLTIQIVYVPTPITYLAKLFEANKLPKIKNPSHPLLRHSDLITLLFSLSSLYSMVLPQDQDGTFYSSYLTVVSIYL